jgi:hypothetical protein
MSYSASGAGGNDMRTELKALAKLNEDIDQLSSDARDCTTLAWEVAAALNLAWYFTEAALRDPSVNRSSCGHLKTPATGFCPCCHHFEELRSKGERVRGLLVRR